MDRIAVIGLYLFALGMFAAPALANVGLGLAVLAALARPRRAATALGAHPALLPMAALALFIAAQAGGVAISQGLSPTAAETLTDLAKLALALPVGLAVAGRSRRARWALGLAALSLLACMAQNAQPAQVWQALLDGHTRLGFGLPMIAFGLYAATAMLGLLLLAPAGADRLPPARRRLTLAATALALLVFGTGLLLCRSRGAWLALALVLPACAAWSWRRGWLPRPAMAGLGALLLAGLLLQGEALARRLADDRAAYQALAGWAGAANDRAAGGLADLPDDSVGLRLRLSALALGHWLERPLTGLGPDAAARAIASADDAHLRAMAHLHNTYAEVLVRFGLLGLAGVAAVLAGLAAGLRKAARAGTLPPELGVFLAGALAITLIWSAFDFRLLAQDFRFHAVLLAGLALGLGLPRRGAACAS